MTNLELKAAIAKFAKIVVSKSDLITSGDNAELCPFGKVKVV